MGQDVSRRLGRGLSALLGELPAPETKSAELPPGLVSRLAPIASIRPNPRNPRRGIEEESLADLAQSIRAHGLVQPIVARRVERGGGLEIIAGERRWRAAQLAGLDHVPVVLVEADDRKALELAIVENVQRADLNPIEEAEGYRALIDEHGYTQADLAATIGKSRVHVTNVLRLLKLPEAVIAHVEAGRLTAGHARALVSSPNPEPLAATVVARGLSVRDTERLVARAEAAPERSARPALKRDKSRRLIAEAVGALLNVKAELRERTDGAGELRLHFRSAKERDALIERLGR